MKWHLRENELPEEKRLVIIYVPNRPWSWNGKGDIHYQIAWLEKLSNNNEVPYYWNTFGPASFFGQEVVAWSYFDEYKGEQRL
jgi:hypothetical protein